MRPIVIVVYLLAELFDDGQCKTFAVIGKQALFGFLYQVFENDDILLIVRLSAVGVQGDGEAGLLGDVLDFLEQWVHIVYQSV